MTDGKHILNTRDLSIGYHDKKKDLILAKDLNLELKKGEIVCLMGKNGIGKSTLLRTLTRVQPVISGNIYINGTDIQTIDLSDLAKNISVVLTERIPQGNLTVYELIALGRQPYTNWIGTLTQKDREKIGFAIEQTGLEDLLNHKYDALSDGQLQRVMICRALAQNTDLIILDEPTAHLDIQHKVETFKILENLAHKLQKSILISTHEIQFGIQMSDRLWLMTEKGIHQGTPKELVQSGSINKLFDNNYVHFDKNSMHFKIQ